MRPEEIFSDIDDALERIAAHCNAYRGGSTWRSIAQLALNLSLYGGLIAACFLLIRSGFWWASLILSIPAAGMLVRLFIIQHDCGHGSFFSNKRANHAVGWILSLFTFTPFGFWRDAHNRHHAHSGNLTRRGMGGVDTLTVEEFKRLSPFKKALYKFYRHPFTLLILGPPIYFILLQRIPHAGPMPYTEVYMGMQSRHIWRSVMLLNGALLFIYGFIMAGFGVGATLLVFVPAVSLAGTIGTWLFYIQHQYEDAYWRPHERWDYKRAALFGSSHYDLPPLLQWFTGNIGLHHIHHLCSLIPNYRLQECFDASTDLQKLPKLTIRESLRCARLALWDEQCERMVSFRAAA
ncbi:MAG: fatty acid desaturase [Pseudomonadota bacterium]